jgi:PAS domain S-box-containing protein
MGLLNPTELLSKESERIHSELRDAQSVYWFTSILCIPFLGFGVFRAITERGAGQVLGFVEIAIFLSLLLNAVLYRRHRRSSITKPIISLIGALLVMALIISGGTSGTGIFWYIVLQTTNFPFLGFRSGKIFTVIYLMMLILLATAGHFGIINSYYDTAHYVQAIIVASILSLSSYATSKAQKDYQDTIDEQQKRMRVLLQGMPAGVMLLSPLDGKPEIVNRAMEKILGQAIRDDVSPEDFMMIYRLTRENGAPFAMDELATHVALRKNERSETPCAYVHRKDGSEAVVKINATPIRNCDGKTVSILSVFEDITEQRRNERDKTQLLTMASRQLQDPMNEIRGEIETLLGGEPGKLNVQQESTLKPIIEIIRRLTNLISDLLSVSGTESGGMFELKPKPNDVIPILRSVTEDLAIVAKRKNVAMYAELPERAVLNVDPGKFRELFANLIGNAVKYAGDPGRVTITTRGDDALGLIFIVHDDGIGIPTDEQKHIFQRFFRASNVGVKIEGTGLGLYIAKKIVDGHGGRIWFESGEGKGTSFFVALNGVEKGTT